MVERMNFVLEDAEFYFRNFAGKEGPYNPPGVRSFSVFIPSEEKAQQMLADGWNIKYTNPSNEEYESRPYIQIAVGYKFPPRIVLITSMAKTTITEETVETLDWVDVKTVDIVVNASNWEVNGKTGVKAYLKTMYLTVDEDPLELKYAGRGRNNDGESS